MCLGLIVYNAVFHKNNAEFKKTALTDKIMGPTYDLVDETRNRLRPLLDVYPREEIVVTTSDGLKLPGFYYKNEKETRNTVILVHGYNGSPYIDFFALVPFYLNNGFNVLCTNNRGGKCGDGNYTQMGTIERFDTSLWVKELVKRCPDTNIYLHGCSMGGAIVCLMSELDLPNVRAILSDCAYKSIRAEFYALCKHVAGITPKVTLSAAFLWYKIITKHSVDEATPIKAVAKSKYPILFIHGKADGFVPVTHAEELYEACTSEKDYLYVENAGHAASFLVDEKGCGEKALNWFEKYAK